MSKSAEWIRLNPVEHFMFADSTSSHPMVFFLRLQVNEVLDPARLSQAAATASQSHPLFGACVVRSWRGCYWKLGATVPEVTSHSYGEYADSRRDWSIDLKRESGLRISVASNSDTSEVWLQVHHSCSDGRGMLDFIRELCTAYRDPGSSERAAPSHDVARLLARRTVGFSASRTDYLWPLSAKWKRLWAYYGHRSKPLSQAPQPDAAQAGSPDDRPFFPTHVSCQIPLCDAHWKSQRDNLAIPATLNDLVLTSAFQCMAKHESQFGTSNGNPWLRIGVPIDMRKSLSSASEDVSAGTERDPIDVASNRTGLVFLNRTPGQIKDSSNLLAGVHNEMRTVKQKDFGTVFFDVLSLANAIPFGIRTAAADRQCALSAIVSNLGLVTDKTAGFKLTGIDFLPPLRSGTLVALGVATASKTMNLSLHYDYRRISQAVAREFLDRVRLDISPLVSTAHVSIKGEAPSPETSVRNSRVSLRVQ